MCRRRRGTRSGETCARYDSTISYASSPWTTSSRKSSLNRSRTTRITRSGSSYSSAGAPPSAARAWMSSHCACSRLTSRASSSSLAPSAAVRTITPAPSGHELLEDVAQPLALDVGQLAADAGGVAVRHVDQVPAGQRDVAGQPGALVADRVLGDLHQHRVAGLERLLDRAGAALQAGGVPVDLAGVEHGVAAAADVDERRLHAGQHVLHLAQVDVADHGAGRRPGHVVLDQDAVLEHGDLGTVAPLAHDHHPVDGLAAGQELRLAAGSAGGCGAARGRRGGAGAWPPAGSTRRRPAPRRTVRRGSRILTTVCSRRRRRSSSSPLRRRRRRRRVTPSASAPSSSSASAGRLRRGVGSSTSSPSSAVPLPRPRPRRPRRRRRLASVGSSSSSSSSSARGRLGRRGGGVRVLVGTASAAARAARGLGRLVRRVVGRARVRSAGSAAARGCCRLGGLRAAPRAAGGRRHSSASGAMNRTEGALRAIRSRRSAAVSPAGPSRRARRLGGSRRRSRCPRRAPVARLAAFAARRSPPRQVAARLGRRRLAPRCGGGAPGRRPVAAGSMPAGSAAAVAAVALARRGARAGGAGGRLVASGCRCALGGRGGRLGAGDREVREGLGAGGRLRGLAAPGAGGLDGGLRTLCRR